MEITKEFHKNFPDEGKRRVKIKRSLCFYNPYEVYIALSKNPEVKRWLEFISNHYIPHKAKILLIYPCSTEKPYNESRSYTRLFKTLDRLGDMRKDVHLVTISEPFGLIPEEFYGKKTKWHNWENSWYDCPGLFEWWCKKHRQSYDEEFLEKCIQILASYVGDFFKKIKLKKSYSKIIAFVRTYSSHLKLKKDHTHRRIIETAAKFSGVSVEILPPKEVIEKIVSKNGRFAWDMYGVAHPTAQEYLFNYLLGALKDDD